MTTGYVGPNGQWVEVADQPADGQFGPSGGGRATVSGDTPVGSLLTCTPPSGMTVTGYQWTRDTGSGPANIGGATSSTYTTTSDDGEADVTCVVTGTYTAAGITVDEAPPSLEPVLVREIVVDFTSFGTTHTRPLIAPVAPGNALIWGFQTNGVPTVLTAVDSAGNDYKAAGETTFATTNSRKGYFYRRGNITNAPDSVTFTTDLNTQVRIYAWEWANLPDDLVVNVTDIQSASAEVGLSEFTTTVANCAVMALVGTSPSRTPTAVAPADLLRLDVSGGSPYSGSVSEHALSRLCETAGANSISSTWTGEGNSTATVFAIAIEPAA